MKKLLTILMFCTLCCTAFSTVQDSTTITIESNRNSQFLTLENTSGKIITIRRNSDNKLVWGDRNCILFENTIKVDLMNNSGVYSISIVEGNNIVGVTINYPTDCKIYLTPKPRASNCYVIVSEMYIKEQY